MTNYIFGLLLLTSSCGQLNNSHETDNWYEDTKQLIVENAESKPDSSMIFFGNQKFSVISYKNGLHIKQNNYCKNTTLCGETLFGKDTTLELRREIYPNGQYAFEGIYYNGYFFGLSTWWYDNGQIRKQGFRFKNSKIGTWREFDKDGKVIAESDYNNLDKLDSLPNFHRK